jgi:putative addiction module killer protein
LTELENTKSIGGGGYRIYLAQQGKQLIILFGGGTKASQKSDIKKAKELYEEYKTRKKNTKKDP